jgi:hypothetical protein
VKIYGIDFLGVILEFVFAWIPFYSVGRIKLKVSKVGPRCLIWLLGYHDNYEQCNGKAKGMYIQEMWV